VRGARDGFLSKLLISSMAVGSTRRAASPAISGMAVTFEVTTGVPHAKASSSGNPKPS
jgi:hypothetical protein